jgi:Ser/Thr protein kinase RdoA (MazF antagonist)
LRAIKDWARTTVLRPLRLRYQAKAAIERYGLRWARVVLLKDDEARGKALFRVKSPGGHFLLRVYEPHWRSGEELGSELLWLQALRRESRLAVPEPIPTVDGSLVGHLSSEEPSESPRCVLLSWQPGRHKITDLSLEESSLIGSYVARLHQHSERYGAPEGFERPRRWRWGYVFRKTVPLWEKGEDVYSPAEMGVFRATAKRVRRDLEELGEGNDVFGVIHSDLRLMNFVFHDGKVYAVDFENCGWGYYFFDLTVTYTTLENHGGKHRTAMQAALLEGYRRERPLPEEHLKYLETFMAMRVVRRVNRILSWETPAQRPWGPSYLAASVERLKEFLRSDGEPTNFDSPWWRK